MREACGAEQRAAEFGVSTMLFFFQAEDGIRGGERSRGLGDVYKGQGLANSRIVIIDWGVDNKKSNS